MQAVLARPACSRLRPRGQHSVPPLAQVRLLARLPAVGHVPARLAQGLAHWRDGLAHRQTVRLHLRHPGHPPSQGRGDARRRSQLPVRPQETAVPPAGPRCHAARAMGSATGVLCQEGCKSLWALKLLPSVTRSSDQGDHASGEPVRHVAGGVHGRGGHPQAGGHGALLPPLP